MWLSQNKDISRASSINWSHLFCHSLNAAALSPSDSRRRHPSEKLNYKDLGQRLKKNIAFWSIRVTGLEYRGRGNGGASVRSLVATTELGAEAALPRHRRLTLDDHSQRHASRVICAMLAIARRFEPRPWYVRETIRRQAVVRGGGGCIIYIAWSDVTVSMATIRSPFCGYNMA